MGEIEMTSMKESSSDLQKPIKSSESQPETIDEITDETDTAVESTPLFNKSEEIPISPSTELRNDEIETTFIVPDYDDQEEPGEENELLETDEIPVDRISTARQPEDIILENLRNAVRDYAAFVIVGALLVVFFLFSVIFLSKCFHS